MWVRDIYEMWKVFLDKMNPQQLYGMALDWSFWYWLSPNLRFSQIRLGYLRHDGLHFIHSASLKNFRTLVTVVAPCRENAGLENWRVQVTGKLTTGDQDVYNGMATQNPYLLPPIQKQKVFLLFAIQDKFTSFPLQYLRRQGRNMTIWMLKQPSSARLGTASLGT